jgi:hypothetical protein
MWGCQWTELSERLDGADHAGHGVGPAAGGAVDGDHRARRRTAQVAQEPALEPEVDAQPLGNREHELPVRHLGADVLGHPTGLLQRPLLVARRAETSASAGIRDQKLLAALGAADAGEAVLEIAALEELAHDCPDDRPPEAIPLLVTLLVDCLELRKEALDQSVKWRLLRVPGTIDAAGLLGPAEHT